MPCRARFSSPVSATAGANAFSTVMQRQPASRANWSAAPGPQLPSSSRPRSGQPTAARAGQGRRPSRRTPRHDSSAGPWQQAGRQASKQASKQASSPSENQRLRCDARPPIAPLPRFTCNRAGNDAGVARPKTWSRSTSPARSAKFNNVPPPHRYFRRRRRGGVPKVLCVPCWEWA